MPFLWKAKLTYDHTKCGVANSSNFPALVYASNASLKDVAHGGKVQSSTGADILFFSDSQLTTQIPSEIQSGAYDNVNGVVWAWVQVSTLSVSTDGSIYIATGNTAPPARTSGVWPAATYVGVWHLTGSPLSATDSSTFGNNGSISPTSPTAGTGKVGGCASYDGNTARNIDVGSSTSMGGLSALTVAGWIKPTAYGDDGGSTILGCPKRRTSALDPYQDFVLGISATGLSFAISTGAAGSRKTYTPAVVNATGNWYYIVATYDGTTMRLYRNGVEVGTGSAAAGITTPATPSTSVRLGQQGIAPSNYSQVNGLLDEVRLLKVGASPSWITASFNSQNAPGNIGSAGFWTWADWEPVGNPSLAMMGVGM